MTQKIYEIELVIEPLPPDTVDNLKAALEPLIRQSLGATGQAQLLEQDVITFGLEQTFPTDAAVTALFYLLGGVALKTFEVTILPEIQRKYRAWVKQQSSRPAQLEPAYRIKLRQLLATYFDAEELRTLCFDLGIDYDDLRGEGKASKARELVAYLERHGRVADLVAIGERQRPDLNWSDVSTPT